MGRLYSIAYGPEAQSAAFDVFEIVAPSSKILVLHKVVLGQTSDAGEAKAAMLTMAMYRVTGSVVSGSGGASGTPNPLDPGDSAASFTVEIGNTTVATGTLVGLDGEPWNAQGGLFWRPTPEERIIIPGGETFVVRVPEDPPESMDFFATAVVEEIG